jgi:hypothetical protein
VAGYYSATQQHNCRRSTGRLSHRRAHVSTLTEVFNYDEELGDRILNHKKKGITKVYNLATRRKERKEALLAWSQYILSLNDRIK